MSVHATENESLPTKPRRTDSQTGALQAKLYPVIYSPSFFERRHRVESRPAVKLVLIVDTSSPKPAKKKQFQGVSTEEAAFIVYNPLFVPLKMCDLAAGMPTAGSTFTSLDTLGSTQRYPSKGIQRGVESVISTQQNVLVLLYGGVVLRACELYIYRLKTLRIRSVFSYQTYIRTYRSLCLNGHVALLLPRASIMIFQ